MADLLDRTATQVRLPGGVVHKREGGEFVPGLGHRYRTRCAMFLGADRGAMLTTRPVGCEDCKAGGRRP